MEKTNVSQPSEQYASFGLGRRNVFMWLASLFMLLSGALRIVYYSSPVEDAEGVDSTAFVLFFVVLPVVFCLWYAAALISKGSERLFTTCTPVFFGTAFLIYRACSCSNPVLSASTAGSACGQHRFLLYALFHLPLCGQHGRKTRKISCRTPIHCAHCFCGSGCDRFLAKRAFEHLQAARRRNNVPPRRYLPVLRRIGCYPCFYRCKA